MSRSGSKRWAQLAKSPLQSRMILIRNDTRIHTHIWKDDGNFCHSPSWMMVIIIIMIVTIMGIPHHITIYLLSAVGLDNWAYEKQYLSFLLTLLISGKKRESLFVLSLSPSFFLSFSISLYNTVCAVEVYGRWWWWWLILVFGQKVKCFNVKN
jgi:hypothetical protein